jgi:hypothetical protein
MQNTEEAAMQGNRAFRYWPAVARSWSVSSLTFCLTGRPSGLCQRLGEGLRLRAGLTLPRRLRGAALRYYGPHAGASDGSDLLLELFGNRSVPSEHVDRADLASFVIGDDMHHSNALGGPAKAFAVRQGMMLRPR